MNADYDLPFLKFKLPEPPSGNEQPETISPSSSPAAPPFKAVKPGSVAEKYEVAVNGVQKQFSHLSTDEIFYPPHKQFDAALARQIALHIMHYELSVPKRRLALELDRSREMLGRALKVINERKCKPDFDRVYQEIAQDVHASLTTKKGGEK